MQITELSGPTLGCPFGNLTRLSEPDCQDILAR